MRSFDYIIVGAGSAGCLLAYRLVKNSNKTVLLIEEGGSNNNIWIQIPVGYFKTIFNPKFTKTFLTNPDPNLNNREFKWPRGKTIGGSGSVNGLVYLRKQNIKMLFTQNFMAMKDCYKYQILLLNMN